MRLSVVLRNSLWVLALPLGAQHTPVPAPAPAANPAEILRLSPRATPNDYQAHSKAGSVTIGAEFMRHAVPTPQGQFNNEDYVTVEVGIFGSPGERTRISVEDFSLRINGKKAIVSQPYGVVMANLKDPDWV